jgi:hypothetical protein
LFCEFCGFCVECRAAVERKGREGGKEILSYFASFATSVFDRDVLDV